MNFDYQAGPTPLLARKNFPILTFLLIAAIILAVLAIVWYVSKKITDYRKSDKYKSAESARLTKRSDVTKFARKNNLSENEANLLWTVARLTKCSNILYLLKNNNEVYNLFSSAFPILKESKQYNDELVNNFFNLLYRIEVIVAQTKIIPSTKFIQLETCVFYISDDGEQYPLYAVRNDKQGFALELPDFLFNSPKKPKILVRQRFTFKTSNGLSYNLIARIIRYETTKEGKNLMIIAHTDDLHTQAQRHFKREFIQETCIFSPIKLDSKEFETAKNIEYSDKTYKGMLSNISAGGCCIQTKLPIKENQYLSVELPELSIDEKIIGIIKRTRRLPSGLFALHIQFKKISIKSKNQIYAMVYKFVL